MGVRHELLAVRIVGLVVTGKGAFQHNALKKQDR